MRPPQRFRLRIAAVASASLLFVVLPHAATVRAQEDPYGPTSTTAPPVGVEAGCTLQSGQSEAGSVVSATLTGAEAGVDVQVFLGDVLVGEVPTGDGDSDFTFVVPDLSPGAYDVVVVGPTATFGCQVDGSLGTLASALEGPDESGDGGLADRVPGAGVDGDPFPGADGGGAAPDGAVLGAFEVTADAAPAAAGARGGPLAFTGLDIAWLVVAGIILVSVGIVVRSRTVSRRHAPHR